MEPTEQLTHSRLQAFLRGPGANGKKTALPLALPGSPRHAAGVAPERKQLDPPGSPELEPLGPVPAQGGPTRGRRPEFWAGAGQRRAPNSVTKARAKKRLLEFSCFDLRE